MGFKRGAARRLCEAASAAALLMVLAGQGATASEFPMGQVLVLDAARIGSSKRVPVLTIEADGRAVIDLWCKTVPARLDVSGATIRIETAPLPEAMPLYMSSGQCSEERLQADVDTLAALTQVTQWQRQGDTVALRGGDETRVLKFRLSTN